jgi:glucosylceramidase
MKKNSPLLFASMTIFLAVLGCWNCSGIKDETQEPTPTYPVGVWTTSPDKVNLLYAKTLDFKTALDDRFPIIQVDTTQVFQTIDGFGYTLTGGSATLLHNIANNERAALLQELFGSGVNSIGISYLRISIGASDLDETVFSYDDLPNGQTDPALLYFNLSRDTLHLIPILKEILAINPNIKIMGSPWSAPVWMKENGNSVGGSLKTQYYSAYAQYFVRYIQSMHAQGINIDAVTPQNEPQHGGNNPSLVMSAVQQTDFIKNHLGPAFITAGINTKIIIWDHNCDNPNYPITILNDPDAKKFIDGSAFHMYNGDESALSLVHDAHPDKNLYFTEQWTGGNSSFSGDLAWHTKHVIIGTLRNWSRIALEWNLANDPNFNPHTPGGCSLCLGALTVNGQTITRNVSYYIIAQATKFVPPGSVRIGSNISGQLQNVAFQTPEGKKVLIVLNDASTTQSFNIHCGEQWIVSTLNPGTVGTFVW